MTPRPAHALGTADMAMLASSATPNPVFINDELTYVVTITNNGPDIATDAGVLMGVLADGGAGSDVELVSSDCPTPIKLPQGLCSYGDMNVHAVVTLHVVVRPLKTGTLNNSILVGSDDADPGSTNNGVNFSTNVVGSPSADLAVSFSSPQVTGLPASQPSVSYTVTVTNHGPNDANSVHVNTTSMVPFASGTITSTTSQGRAAPAHRTWTVALARSTTAPRRPTAFRLSTSPSKSTR